MGEICIRNLNLKPDIIVLDHHLDSKYSDATSGLDMVKQIGTTNPEIKIIMLSGQDDLEVAVSSLQNGAYDYIVKNKSAFVRLNYSVSKIIKGIRDKKELILYKKATYIISIIFIILIITLFILWKYIPSVFEV